jgi:xanthine dehydrogenase accessory factor
MTTVLVRGTGDVGSAVATLLHSEGYAVVVHDEPAPSHARRGMAFVDALYGRTPTLEGVLAKRARAAGALTRMLACGKAVPVTDAPLDDVIAEVRPDVVVDARMRKRAAPAPVPRLAPLVIGLGPSFEAGNDVDVAIETQWGEDLGAIVRTGRTRPLAGEPRPLAGYARERFVYAPVDGTFRTSLDVGDVVQAGREIARVGGVPIAAPLDGTLRGIAHDGADVRRGAKVVEVDAGADARAAAGLGERPRRIAQGVLAALAEAGVGRPASPPAP